ncbi:hypothetical protein [uncultured Thermanaerothrix sp.]|uniref:hypothetical protein n=1 Tax=uncultured Thermanaerothrix sp. TaxID=1195149 RepID=UPI0026046025|nr:hypothetical protein [uncultured Thermanaerothrix sp.]
MAKQRFPWIGSLMILGVVGLPYIFAALVTPEGYVFGGFLFNPLDGNSYLAKMYEGFLGEWRFRLPYTAEASYSVYLFTFYIFLGHLARLFHLPLIVMFHLARLLADLIFMLALWRFLNVLMEDSGQGIVRMYYWALLGSGLGWLFSLTGGFTADFWLAEAYPLLSMFANPHFPLGTGLLLLFFSNLLKPFSCPWVIVLSIVLGVTLAIVLPFGVVVGSLVGGGYCIWLWYKRQKVPLSWMFGFALGGGSVLILQYTAILQDIWLRGWNAQNLTPSPPLWDYLVAFSPALILAFLGLTQSKQGISLSLPFLIIWFIAGWVMAYSPWGLQRRLLVGFYIPVVILAVRGGSLLRHWLGRVGGFIEQLALILALPTGFLIILMGLAGVRAQHPLLTLRADEYEVLEWISEHTPPEALVFAAPETGLFIPAHTGRRVIYGHPFETVNAEEQSRWVTDSLLYARAPKDLTQRLRERGVDFVFWGPREQSAAQVKQLDFLPVLVQAGDTALYAIPLIP